MIYKILGVAAVVALIVFFIWDNGRDHQNEINLKKETKDAAVNLDVERKQNEIRSNVISDDDFLIRLQRGEFGQLPN